MNRSLVATAVAVVIVLVSICASAGIGMHHAVMPDHSASNTAQCCAVVSSGFAMEGTGATQATFFTALFFTLVFAIFAPPKRTASLYHPPRY